MKPLSRAVVMLIAIVFLAIPAAVGRRVGVITLDEAPASLNTTTVAAASFEVLLTLRTSEAAWPSANATLLITVGVGILVVVLVMALRYKTFEDAQAKSTAQMAAPKQAKTEQALEEKTAAEDLRPGDRVLALVDFATDGLHGMPSVQIRTGMRGTVLRLDADGDAQVRFDAVGESWVMTRHICNRLAVTDETASDKAIADKAAQANTVVEEVAQTKYAAQMNVREPIAVAREEAVAPKVAEDKTASDKEAEERQDIEHRAQKDDTRATTNADAKLKADDASIIDKTDDEGRTKATAEVGQVGSETYEGIATSSDGTVSERSIMLNHLTNYMMSNQDVNYEEWSAAFQAEQADLNTGIADRRKSVAMELWEEVRDDRSLRQARRRSSLKSYIPHAWDHDHAP